jgi:hypothetical protein
MAQKTQWRKNNLKIFFIIKMSVASIMAILPHFIPKTPRKQPEIPPKTPEITKTGAVNPYKQTIWRGCSVFARHDTIGTPPL